MKRRKNFRNDLEAGQPAVVRLEDEHLEAVTGGEKPKAPIVCIKWRGKIVCGPVVYP